MNNTHRAWFTPAKAVLGVVILGALAWGTRVAFFSEPVLPPVITAPVTVGALEDAVLASGIVAAAKNVNVGAQASGQIKRLHVALGETVRQGQLIAEIDSTTQQNALRNAQAQVALLEAQLKARQASLRQSELAFERAKELLDQDAGTRADYESAQASLASARAETVVLTAQIQQARTSQDTARVNLAYTRITAPIDGVVVAVLAEEGRTVNAMQSAPTIIKLAQLDTVQIKAQISEADVVRVKPGLPVYFTILGEPDTRYESTLRSIEPVPESEQADSAVRTATATTGATAVYYNGLFEVPNPKGKLRVAMTAQVFVVLARVQDALLIPATALSQRSRAGQYTVRVLEGEGKDRQLTERTVRIGLNNRVQAQVLQGLHAGDKVVVGEAGGEGSSAAGKGRRGARMF